MNARALAAATLALSLAGCGQTGALYLPDEGTSTPVEIRPIGGDATPATAPAPAAPAAQPRDDEKKPAAPAGAPAPTATP